MKAMTLFKLLHSLCKRKKIRGRITRYCFNTSSKKCYSQLIFTLHLALITFLSFPVVLQAAPMPKLQLATHYQVPDNIEDYLVSEKLDGIRGYWTGKLLLTKQGNIINTPAGYTKRWPSVVLEGELWSKRSNFESISGCVRRKTPNKACWNSISFHVFDMPEAIHSFKERHQQFSVLISASGAHNLHAIPQRQLASLKALHQWLDNVVKKGGEGLMLHHQLATYQSGRNKAVMKLKKHQDAEAVVIKHLPGKGKYTGKLGALVVRTLAGADIDGEITFRLGSGFSDHERENPPKIGNVITFKYFGKTKYGVPRFASYIRIRVSNDS